MTTGAEVTSFKLPLKAVAHLATMRQEITRQESMMNEYVQGIADSAGLPGDWTLNEEQGTLEKVK